MKKENQVIIKEFNIREISIPIHGITPLIVNHKPIELIDKLLAKSTKAASAGREPQDIDKEYNQSKYISKDGWEGIPASAFKSAMIRAAKLCGMVMIDTATSISIVADCNETQLIHIEGESEMLLEAIPLKPSGMLVSSRAIYKEWSAILTVRYNAGMISMEQVCQLIQAAGFGVGIGAKRPEKTNYEYGKWELMK